MWPVGAVPEAQAGVWFKAPGLCLARVLLAQIAQLFLDMISLKTHFLRSSPWD